ncbi:PREDICTED: reactive oxygen species modulator 1 [Ceratosolen solmsi marchali]|uniref:Reactive oxygen species modulator 1 n=1 Tax=Ceratosolen solmsi marchali TaxID=326594 RepID=A0AAJ6YP26_9HYME|nr:PREDICTED: reactive oxygen species modulator 1 [Ceratosolen solmsi marchali]
MTMTVASKPFYKDQKCWDKLKVGFLIGACVGIASGAIFGGYRGLRFGYRGQELIYHTTKEMSSGAITFGTFMAIGTGIRC